MSLRITFYSHNDRRIGTYRDTADYTPEEARKQVDLVLSELMVCGLDSVAEFTPCQWALNQLDKGSPVKVKRFTTGH